MANDSLISRTNRAFADLARRVDRFFLSDDLRNQSIRGLAHTRMGVIASLALGVAILTVNATQMSIWSPGAMLGFWTLGAIVLGAPFVARQTNAIRVIGQLACLVIAICIGVVFALSAGQATGALPALLMLPMIALVVRGRRVGLAWTAVSVGLLALGRAMLSSGVAPMGGYAGTSIADQYEVALVCIIGMAAITFAFDSAWNRTAVEFTDRAKADLIAREERYRNLLEHASEGILVVDAEAQIKFATPAAERLFGIERGSAIGENLRSFTTTDEIHRVAPAWNRMLRTDDAVARFQIQLHSENSRSDFDSVRTIETTASNRIAVSTVGGIILHLHDITSLVRAESNYETLAERSLQGIAVILDGQIVYANQALADLFGVGRESLLHRQTEKEAGRYIHRNDLKAVKAAYSGSSNESLKPVDMRHMHADGSWRWLQLRWSDSTWEGKPARQALYVDITAQKALEESREREHERLELRIRERTLELEASQRTLREKDRLAAIGTLAAGIAHQINNPIGAILTSAEFAILVDEDDERDEIRSQALDEIRGQAIRCGKIVRSILQFSRAEPTEKWSSDLASVLRIAVDVTSRYAREKSAVVQLDVSQEASERRVRMNPIEIEQVFVNLIRNAIEAQDSGAKIVVRARLCVEDGGAVEVLVEDDGPGIVPDDQGRIFEPFFTTRLREGGSGLGLSVAHGIIEDHAGRLWIESPLHEDRTGTQFHVVLPLEMQPTNVEGQDS